MLQGCTQPSADNFSASATIWDYSCFYIIKKDGQCLVFRDVQEMEDKSFTMSYSVEAGNWVFFHDAMPDYYFHTREKLFNLSNQTLYKHNAGEYGQYYQNEEESKKAFFIDVVFNAEEEILLETVNWVSSVLEDSSDASTVGSEWNTLTHISIWNSQQHTGRLDLKTVFADLQYQTSRNTNGAWSFNDFRNVVALRGTQFILDLFNDYILDSIMVEDKAWYEQELIQDKYMIVRFEFDNSLQKQLLLHDTSIQAQKAKR
jgi:hypothetical protein